MKTGIKNSIIALGIFASTATLVSAAYFDNTPVQACGTQIISSLQLGSEGNEVLILQNLLSRGSYMYVAPNGHFGPATQSALKRFQIDNAIYPTGMVGPLTRNAINERLCDSDVRGDSMSYNQYGYNGYSYGYSSGTTYVDNFDPFVRVISPTPANPSVYNNPATNVAPISNVAQLTVPPVSTPVNYTTNNVANNVVIPSNVTPVTTAISSTNIIYSPYIGYTYGIVPQSGVLTITTPLANSGYNEGDTVNLAWTTSNLNATQYQILLENTTSNQSKVVAVTSTKNASFVLTKEVLDSVCSGTCSNPNTGAFNTGSFRIVITTPITDIAGITSTFRAAVSPITIKRPYYAVAQVSISASKTPVNSGEGFRLYVNVPTPNYTYGTFSFKIKAICVNNVQVSIAGVPCGQDFAMPVNNNYFQQEVPSMITNSSWYRQDVVYEINAIDMNGSVIGTARTTVTVNPAPFSF